MIRNLIASPPPVWQTWGMALTVLTLSALLGYRFPPVLELLLGAGVILALAISLVLRRFELALLGLVLTAVQFHWTSAPAPGHRFHFRWYSGRSAFSG